MAFVGGILHGALESVWDLLTGLVDLVELVWNILKSAFTLELLSDVKSLWDLVSSLKVKELIDAGLNAFLDRWNAPELMRRWHFRGWLVGYAIAEIALMLLGGAAVLKWLGKAGKLGKLLEKFPRVAKALAKVDKAWKAAPKAAKEKFRKAVTLGKKKRLLEYKDVSEKIRKIYKLAEFERIVDRGEDLGLKAKEVLDFLEMGTIAKPWKKPPKFPLSAETLIQQMENWTQVIRKRGYPYLFDSLDHFRKFQARVKKLLKKYKVPDGRIVVQGSALRTPLAKDIDVAIFVTKEVFEAYVARCRAGVTRRAKRSAAKSKLAAEIEKNASEGFVSKFHFDRPGDVPGTSFEKELWGVLEDTFKKEVDISVMTSTSKLDLYPSMDI